MQGKALYFANICEVVYHRQTIKFVAGLANHSPTACDNDLGKVIVQRYSGIAEGYRCIAVYDECGQARDVHKPTLKGNIVITISSTSSDICHLQIHLLITVQLSMLTHS